VVQAVIGDLMALRDDAADKARPLAASRPIRKKVARAPPDRSAARAESTPRSVGPSSNVRATMGLSVSTRQTISPTRVKQRALPIAWRAARTAKVRIKVAALHRIRAERHIAFAIAAAPGSLARANLAVIASEAIQCGVSTDWIASSLRSSQ
jgi:hypothetical protein